LFTDRAEELRDKCGIDYRITGIASRRLGWLADADGFAASFLSDPSASSAPSALKKTNDVREWLADGQSAGFSYDAEGFGRRKSLFDVGTNLQAVTGFRCLFREHP